MNSQLALPLARATDPDTSQAAAESVKPANSELIRRIRAVVEWEGPLTQEAIAERVDASCPGRWRIGTIVTACARAHLQRWGTHVVKRADGSTKCSLATWIVAPLPCATVALDTDVL